MKLSTGPCSVISNQDHGWITNVQRFSLHDGPGIRSVIFFKGCQMRCEWCANPEGLSVGFDQFYDAGKCHHCGECSTYCPTGRHHLIHNLHVFNRSADCIGCRQCERVCPAQAIRQMGEKIDVNQLFERVMADETWFRNSGGGVTLSGGEVATQPDFASQLLDKLCGENIHCAIETAGYASWHSLYKIISRSDLVMYDLKSANDELHKRHTGVSNKIILRNLYRLGDENIDTIIRIPVIPGFNDSEEQAAELLSLVRSFKKRARRFKGIELLPYHRFGTGKYALLDKNYEWNSDNPNIEVFLQQAAETQLEVSVSGTLLG